MSEVPDEQKPKSLGKLFNNLMHMYFLEQRKLTLYHELTRSLLAKYDQQIQEMPADERYVLAEDALVVYMLYAGITKLTYDRAGNDPVICKLLGLQHCCNGVEFRRAMSKLPQVKLVSKASRHGGSTGVFTVNTEEADKPKEDEQDGESRCELPGADADRTEELSEAPAQDSDSGSGGPGDA